MGRDRRRHPRAFLSGFFAETDGGVRVTTNESFAGDPVSDDIAGVQAQLDASLVAWLDYLRSAAASSG